MKKKYLKCIAASMVWTIPLVWFVMLAFIWKEWPELLQRKSTLLYTFGAAALAYLWVITQMRCRPSPDLLLKEKNLAQEKTVRQQLRAKKPEGIMFGKQDGMYVRKPIEEDGHVLVIGGSGSGKSSAGVIPTLLV